MSMGRKLYGLVLCGGMSVRMGSDKGLLDYDGLPWFLMAAQKLAPFCDEVFISIRKEQKELYRAAGVQFSPITDRHDTGVEGPARGIISAAMAHPDVNWFVLSTDMIRITPATLAALRSTWETHQGIDAVCFEVGHRIEPLCAIYTARGVERLRDEMISRKNYSAASILKYMDLYVSPPGKISPDEFLSFNGPEDLGL